MTRIALTVSVTLLLAGATATFALAVALRAHVGNGPDAARVALLGWDTPSGTARTAAASPRSDARARYWWALAAFEHAIAPGRSGRDERRRALAALSTELRAQAGRGASGQRAVALGLLALTRLTTEVLGQRTPGAGPPQSQSAIAALRAAVVLDPDDADAKANLELLLRASLPKKRQGQRPMRLPGRNGRKHRSGSTTLPVVSGAAYSAQLPPVGY